MTRFWQQAMKKENTGFILALITWLMVTLVTLYHWYEGTLGLAALLQPEPWSLALVLGLFLLFIIGYALIGDVFSNSKQSSIPWTGLLLSAFSIFCLVTLFQYGLIGILAIIVVAQLPTIFNAVTCVIWALLIPIIGTVIDAWFKDLSGVVANSLLYALFNLFALLASYRFIVEKEAKNKSLQLLRELEATQILLSATTKRDERLRVARDIHDVLGHHLTALNLQLEVASHVDSKKIKDHVLRAKSICGLLLADVRETVSEFRAEQNVDLSDALKTLCRDIPGIDVSLDISLATPQLNARIAEVIFRSVQESITNMIKHSNASHCQVSLSQCEGWLKLTVLDNGKSIDKNHTNILPGNGLKGMAERVVKVDGSMVYEYSNVGFKIDIKLPDYMI
ncbi:MAG: histidine kinase [Bermanella sp.]